MITTHIKQRVENALSKASCCNVKWCRTIQASWINICSILNKQDDKCDMSWQEATWRGVDPLQSPALTSVVFSISSCAILWRLYKRYTIFSIFCNNRVNSFFKINLNLKERIKAIVTENRKSLASGKMGSKAWWKKVDALSKRKERSNPSFDEDSVRRLNHYILQIYVTMKII